MTQQISKCKQNIMKTKRNGSKWKWQTINHTNYFIYRRRYQTYKLRGSVYITAVEIFFSKRLVQTYIIHSPLQAYRWALSANFRDRLSQFISFFRKHFWSRGVLVLKMVALFLLLRLGRDFVLNKWIEENKTQLNPGLITPFLRTNYHPISGNWLIRKLFPQHLLHFSS